MPENDVIILNDNYLRSIQYDEYYADFNKKVIFERDNNVSNSN